MNPDHDFFILCIEMSLISMEELEKGKCYNDKDGKFVGMLMFKPGVWGIHQTNSSGKRIKDDWYVAHFVKDEGGKLVDDMMRIEMTDASKPQFQEVDCAESKLLDEYREISFIMSGAKKRMSRRRRARSRRNRRYSRKH